MSTVDTISKLESSCVEKMIQGCLQFMLGKNVHGSGL
jgi:hypothetical protein